MPKRSTHRLCRRVRGAPEPVLSLSKGLESEIWQRLPAHRSPPLLFRAKGPRYTSLG